LSEYDIHVSNATNDTQLYNDLRALSQAAIQNGQATIGDLIAISQSESVQEIARRLEDSARKIKEENQAMQEKQLQAQQEQAQMAMQQEQAKQMFEMKKHEDNIAVDREKIQANLQIAGLNNAAQVDKNLMDVNKFVMENDRINEENLRKVRVDTDKNGIDDYLDLRRTDVDENYKREQVRIADAKLAETVRSNRAKEELLRDSINNKPKEKSSK